MHKIVVKLVAISLITFN